MSLIPVTGVVLLLKIDARRATIWKCCRTCCRSVAVTGGCCLLAVRWAVDQFNSENVLFRESERGGLGLWFRHLLRDREDTPSIGRSRVVRRADPDDLLLHERRDAASRVRSAIS